MIRKRIKFISEELNHYNTIQEAMDDFLKFKTAQGMSELTMRDYNKTFERFMRISSNVAMKSDIIKKELLEFLTPLSDASPAKFNRPYSNLNTLFNWLVQQNAIEYNGLVHREVYKEIPPKVEYSLTETGRSFIPVMLEIMEWGGRLYQKDRELQYGYLHNQ
jgi:DNA-binding HxlR family transcriptional regulator